MPMAPYGSRTHKGFDKYHDGGPPSKAWGGHRRRYDPACRRILHKRARKQGKKEAHRQHKEMEE